MLNFIRTKTANSVVISKCPQCGLMVGAARDSALLDVAEKHHECNRLLAVYQTNQPRRDSRT